MIEGIIVLNQEYIYKYHGFATAVFLISCISGIVFFIIGALNEDKCGNVYPICAAAGIICLIITAWAAIYAQCHQNTFDHVEYEVILQDNVSMNEFISKYDVIDKHGSVYTIVEKDKE